MRSNASRTSEVRSGGIYLDVSVWESSRAERFTYTHAHALNSEGTRQRGRDACSDACTYYGARQYLNTLDGKVVHEGEIGIPLCSGVRRVRARGWTGRLLGERGGREGGGWICTRGTSRSHKGMEQIGSHSFIRLPCIFSPCLTGRASSTTLLLLSLHLHSLCPVLCLQVRSITISLPFLSFSLLFFPNPLSLRTVDVGKKICRCLSSRDCYFNSFNKNYEIFRFVRMKFKGWI